MWVFDGEEWTQDQGTEWPKSDAKPETTRQRFDELVPELQVIEIVHIPKKDIPVPPLPMP